MAELATPVRPAKLTAVKKSKTKTKKNKGGKKPHDPVTPFRNKLWDLFRDLAKGMNGADVVIALKQAGEEIWTVGIDDSYTSMSQSDQEQEPLGNAFDISWLTVVCIKLMEIKQGKKPTVRIHS